MASRSAGEVYGAMVDRLVKAASADGRVKALWLEGGTLAELRRPYRRLEVHLASDEPDFPSLAAELEGFIGAGGLTSPRWSDVPRFARQLEGLLEGFPITAVLEKSSLLAKRPRSAVVPLVDKTGHLCHVMDFSRQGS
jgi:hypothetical protein